MTVDVFNHNVRAADKKARDRLGFFDVRLASSS